MINRNKYLNLLKKENLKFSCSFCEEGVLGIVEETFKMKSTLTSEYVYEMTREIDLLKNIFVTFLKCGNEACGEIFAVTGIAHSNERVDSCGDDCEYTCGNPHLYIDNKYEILSTEPPIDIIKIPEEIPEKISVALKESFSLFWGHPSSAGNEIRKTLEIFMDELGVKEKGTSDKGDEFDLTLHARIEEFGKNKKYKGLSKKLLAVKWLGNAGSHKKELSKEDIFDAYRVLAHVLDEIFVRPKHVLSIVKTAKKLDETFNLKAKKQSIRNPQPRRTK